ncbi:hypothetical protein SAY86_028814 [Trapa natans]|uniref:PH domain-containing protein n=1 Tax=Trapa natans TaxID=22666 RepID=A0AAN7RGR9_TRANT|nr:hypothetical protein SAY86_028814 [Trapa natans]
MYIYFYCESSDERRKWPQRLRTSLSMDSLYRPSSFTVNCLIAPSSVVPAGVVGRHWKVADARLTLRDGSIWRDKSFGAAGTQVGEAVFNTSLNGYQEIHTDPSYGRQFVLMTNPHNGNTGVKFVFGEFIQLVGRANGGA